MKKVNVNRLAEFQKLLAANGLDGYVVTKKADQGFLTGLFLEGYYLLVGRHSAHAFMSQMLLGQFKESVKSCKAEFAPPPLTEAVIKCAKAQKMARVGFDSASESYSVGVTWKKAGFVEKPSLVEQLRLVKKGAEISALKKSCKAAISAFKIVKPLIKPGMTELQVKNKLESVMADFGASGPSFDIIVGVGPNAAKPHHVTSLAKVKNNEALLIDFGCVLDNYCSDITRTYFVGNQPTEEFKEVYDIVERAQKAGVKAVREGVLTGAVDKVCRDIITEAGYGDRFIHTTGHGIGIEIHETPRLKVGGIDILHENMAVTVEPGIYLPGKFGVRIEDTVLVTKKGCEILTK